MGYPFFVVLLFVNLSNEVERIRFIMTETRKWKQSFLIVALGQAVSLLGSHGVQFALIWWLAGKCKQLGTLCGNQFLVSGDDALVIF